MPIMFTTVFNNAEGVRRLFLHPLLLYRVHPRFPDVEQLVRSGPTL